MNTYIYLETCSGRLWANGHGPKASPKNAYQNVCKVDMQASYVWSAWVTLSAFSRTYLVVGGWVTPETRVRCL